MCTTCGATIVDPEPRRPCLHCGSEARTKSIRIHSTVAVRSDLSSAIDYKFPRSWDEVWYDLGRHLDLLRQCYLHIQPPNVSPRDVIDKYFGICHRLVDALRHNTETATHGSDARNQGRLTTSIQSSHCCHSIHCLALRSELAYPSACRGHYAYAYCRMLPPVSMKRPA